MLLFITPEYFKSDLNLFYFSIKFLETYYRVVCRCLLKVKIFSPQLFIGSDNGYLKLFNVENRQGISESLIMKQCRSISHICCHPLKTSVAVASHVTSYSYDVTSMVIVWKIVGEMVRCLSIVDL